MSDPVLDVRSARALLRRHRRLLAAAVVAGVLAAVAYVVLAPPRLTSTTLVLLPTPSAGQGVERDPMTQVRIALSSAVLAAAGATLDPAMPLSEVENRVSVEAPTNQLVEIKASSPDAARAAALSQGVADAYVAFVREADRRVTTAALADLDARETDLQRQVGVLQGEIDAAAARQRDTTANSVEGRREGQLLARLRAEQADVSLQLDKVKGDIATSAPAGSAAGAGTAVLQDASPAVGPHLGQRLFTWLPLGALVGFALVAGTVLLTSRRDPRMGLRDEIADAVGSPVLAATRSHAQRSVAGWLSLLRSYEATAVESWAFRQVLRGLAPADARAAAGKSEGRTKVEHPRSITVICLAGDPRALAAGPQLAAFAASLGIATRVVAGPGHERAASLWAALSTDQTVHPRPHLTLGPADDDEPVELTVVLVAVDRRTPTLGEAPPTAVTVLAVAAGGATEQELARVAVAVDDAGRRIEGVVVVDPDRADRTTGRHLLDERAGRIALPVRLTGVGPATAPAAGDPQRRRS